MNLEDAEILANLLIEQYLPKLGWSFGWHNAKRTFGTCNYCTRKISLSKPLTAIQTEKHVEDTILHEIAHALTPGSGHGPEWKRQAILLGCTPKATSYSDLEEGKSELEPTWVMVFGTNIVRKYYRRPNDNTFRTLHTRFLRGRRSETMGKLELLPYAEYKRIS